MMAIDPTKGIGGPRQTHSTQMRRRKVQTTRSTPTKIIPVEIGLRDYSYRDVRKFERALINEEFLMAVF